MTRPLRIEYAGAVYHITSRGNEKKAVFKDDQDRMNFLNTLQHVNKRYNWLCHAYCEAFLKMKKFDIKTLERAYKG